MTQKSFCTQKCGYHHSNSCPQMQPPISFISPHAYDLTNTSLTGRSREEKMINSESKVTHLQEMQGRPNSRPFQASLSLRRTSFLADLRHASNASLQLIACKLIDILSNAESLSLYRCVPLQGLPLVLEVP